MTLSGKFQINQSATMKSTDEDWRVFGRTPADGVELLIRSRTHQPSVRDYAQSRAMARLRCVLAADNVRPGGMPISTAEVDEYEDALTTYIDSVGTDVQLLAAVTGEGCRDLFYAATDLDDLRAAIKAVAGDRSFSIKIGLIAEKAPFLDRLTLTDAMLNSAVQSGNVKAVPGTPKRGLFGRLLGR